MNGSPEASATVSLREVTRDTVWTICNLNVSEYQRQFVASNALSIAQAYFEPETAWFRAIYADDTPVGFVMLSDNLKTAEYDLWRFMVDQRYQGRGFGRKAMELVIAYIRTRPNAKQIRLSYHRADGGPDGFYRKMGFVDTGEMWGDEHVMALGLTP